MPNPSRSGHAVAAGFLGWTLDAFDFFIVVFLYGILQSGYSWGYLLAAIAARVILPNLGWRAMFWAGGAPALLALYVRFKVPESQAWEQHRAHNVSAIFSAVATYWKSFIYLMLLMTLMMFLSHGTQDLYPDFLKVQHKFAPSIVSYVAMFYNVGAILGAVIFGYYSERIGRRYSMLAALALSLAVIPLWAFSSGLARLALGAFLMQVGVQGAWGIIPAHLNELAPDAALGLVPGLTYQLGILFPSPLNTTEHHLYNHLVYHLAFASFELANILLLATVVFLGHERKGREFVREQALTKDSPAT